MFPSCGCSQLSWMVGIGPMLSRSMLVASINCFSHAASFVIAVQTSVGYGASFGGLTALLGMLNSCGSGVTVVNIDNGFGAGYAASQINALASDT